ncbi:hypothetical protein Emed_002005 [Eimeria media]
MSESISTLLTTTRDRPHTQDASISYEAIAASVDIFHRSWQFYRAIFHSEVRRLLMLILTRLPSSPHMLPAYSSQQRVERRREKRRGCESLAVEEPEAKRAACQTAEGGAPADLKESAALESHSRGCSTPIHQALIPEASQVCSEGEHGSSPLVALARGGGDTPLRVAEEDPFASPLSLSKGKQTAKMDSKHPHSHRKPEDVELAIEVLNDELADASPLDRPSLELATQTLMERLVEMRKRRPSDDKPSESSAAGKQSTQEYARTLQAVVVGEGTQKYTLIRIPMQDDMSGDVYLVRGDPKAEYHYQTALDTLNELQERNIMSDVTGGGRMDVLTSEKKIEIYGYSHQYGAADHSITAKMVKDHFGVDFIVSFGNYGY